MSSVSDFAMFRFNFWHKPFFPHHAAAIAAAQAGQPGMENSTYVPNPLSSPALMVLASTAENHEGGRLPVPSHPFSGQTVDGKDIHTPFSTPPFTMYRPGDPFPPPLYSSVPPFIRPSMDRNMALLNPGGGSAFRPVSTEAEPSYHSAFGPAAKKQKHDDVHLAFSPGGKADHEFRDSTPDGEESKGSSTPQIKEERPSSLSSVTNSESFSDGGDIDTGAPDEGRSLRKQRKKCILDGQTPCCPVCGLTLRSGEVESHFAMEMDRLEKIVRCGRKSRDTTPQGRKTLPSPLSNRRGKDSPSIEAASQSRFDTYMRIKCNRQARLSARSRNRKRKTTEETVCPICNEKLVGCPEELNVHVELCLKRRSDNDVEDEPIDVEGDQEQYEEYTWAGQTRIRATSMLQGGFSGSGFQTAKKHPEEDLDLNVDGDDSEQYGQPQFGEVDIIPCSLEEPQENKERDALRGAILGSSSSRSSSLLEVINSQNMEIEATEDSDHSPTHSSAIDKIDPSLSASEVIAALKSRLKEKEKEASKERHKCLICMEMYRKPLTSIQCWHVHCEECWLKTLGAKKLCPQCNMITAASDLRRIFL